MTFIWKDGASDFWSTKSLVEKIGISDDWFLRKKMPSNVQINMISQFSKAMHTSAKFLEFTQNKVLYCTFLKKVIDKQKVTCFEEENGKLLDGLTWGRSWQRQCSEDETTGSCEQWWHNFASTPIRHLWSWNGSISWSPGPCTTLERNEQSLWIYFSMYGLRQLQTNFSSSATPKCPLLVIDFEPCKPQSSNKITSSIL